MLVCRLPTARPRSIMARTGVGQLVVKCCLHLYESLLILVSRPAMRCVPLRCLLARQHDIQCSSGRGGTRLFQSSLHPFTHQEQSCRSCCPAPNPFCRRNPSCMAPAMRSAVTCTHVNAALLSCISRAQLAAFSSRVFISKGFVQQPPASTDSMKRAAATRRSHGGNVQEGALEGAARGRKGWWSCSCTGE